MTSATHHSTASRIRAAAMLVAVSALLSRLLGFVRDAVIAWRLGAGAETDAYYAAFLLPDMLYYFVSGGALSLAFLPTYTRTLAAGDERRGLDLLRTVGTITTGALFAAIAVGFVFTEPIVRTLYPSFDAAQVERTVWLTRVLLPQPLFLVVGALLNATEQAHGRFAATAVSPLIYNLGIIVGGVALAPWHGPGGFAWGATVGACLGPLLVPAVAARARLRMGARWVGFDDDVRIYFRAALPLMLGISLLTVDEWLGRFFAADLGDGAITHLNNARRLLLIPVALIGQAIGQAAQPFLARLAAEGRTDELNAELSRSTAAAGALAAVAAGGLFLFAPLLVAIVYERGEYDASDAAATALALAVMAPAVVGWIGQQIAVRGLYAVGETWRPMALSTAVALGSVPVYAVLSRHGLAGIAAATGVGMTAAFALTAWLHHRRFGGSLARAAADGVARGVLGASVGAIVVLGGRTLIGAGASIWAQLPLAAAYGIAALGAVVASGGAGAAAIRRQVGRLARRR